MTKVMIPIILFCVCFFVSAQTKKTEVKDTKTDGSGNALACAAEDDVQAKRESLKTELIIKELLVGNLLLKYYFSNNLNAIELCVYDASDREISLENIAWKLNPNIPKVIKNEMSKLDVNYAMRPHASNYLGDVTLYRRVGNQWFSYSF